MSINLFSENGYVDTIGSAMDMTTFLTSVNAVSDNTTALRTFVTNGFTDDIVETIDDLNVIIPNFLILI